MEYNWESIQAESNIIEQKENPATMKDCSIILH